MTRRVMLIEIETPLKPVDWGGSKQLEADLNDRLAGQYGIVAVWGQVSGVDAAFRKLRQLSAETEGGRSQADRIHSAHKAMSFFRDMWPQAFWEWKRIGGEHPSPAERPMMAGR